MQYIINPKQSGYKQVYKNHNAEIAEIGKQGKVITVTVSDKKPTRSNQQNRYAHKLIGLIADKEGERLESVKKQIKHKIGLIEKTMINGELITEIKSTADLDKDEFSKFINEVIKVCEFLEIDYPIPSYYGMEI